MLVTQEVLVFFLVWLSADYLLSSSAQDTISGNCTIEYIPGNINLLLSVPHDGTVKIRSIINRSFRRNNGRDLNTSNIAETLLQQYLELSGRKEKPHILIARIHRSNVDFNRDIKKGARGYKLPEKIWKDYHGIIKSVRESFSNGIGLVVDLHGQDHKTNTSELGYVWTQQQLNSLNYSCPSSIRGLMERKKLSPTEILTGPASFGNLLEKEGYKAVPSVRQPTPGVKPYYRGGYITQEYGSRNGGYIDAIQIEVPGEIRYGGGTGLNQMFARKLAKILKHFYDANYKQ